MTKRVEQVSERLFQARWKNAQRIGHKLIELQKAGYLIFDENNDLTYDAYVNENGMGFKSSGEGGTCYFVLFNADPTFDDGAFTPIKEFNAELDDYKIVHPSMMKSLRRYMNV